jgi:predicted transcriptional regulator
MSNWLVGELGSDIFGLLTTEENDAVGMLRRDHDSVKALFDRFETTEHKAERSKIAKRAIQELRIHSTIEQELFYPAIREHLKNDLMNEADEEHHIAKLLIAELAAMSSDNDHYDAKFTVLAENVRRHIKEEESHMLAKALDLPIDFKALAQQMARRKEELKTTGLLLTAEDAMIRKCQSDNHPRTKATARKKDHIR